jgi:hypothetical protein
MLRSTPAARRILLAALLVRGLLPLLVLAATGDAGAFVAEDSHSYLGLADALVENRAYERGEEPEILRTPGYPLLLVPGVLAGHPVAWAIGLNLLLAVATVYLLVILAEALGLAPGSAALAALLLAVEPVSVLATSRVLSETSFTFFVVLALTLVAGPGPSPARAAASGLALAAASLVRPVGVVLPLAVLPVFVRLPWGRGLVAAAAFLSAGLGPPALWVLRNEVRAGYAGFAAIGDVNLYYYDAAAMLGRQEGVPYREVRDRLGFGIGWKRYLEVHPEQADWPPSRRFVDMRNEARKVIAAAPLLFARVRAEGTARMMIDPGATDYLKLFGLHPERGGLLHLVIDRGLLGTAVDLARSEPIVLWSNVLLGVPLAAYLAAAAVGLLAIARRRSIAGGWHALLLVGAYLAVVSGGPAAYSRFRQPLMPVVCLLAAAGLSRVSSTPLIPPGVNRPAPNRSSARGRPGPSRKAA